jgi:homoserine kinase type II
MLRAAAWLLGLWRLYHPHLPRAGSLTHAHDPGEFERVLRQRATNPPRLAARPRA